MFIYDIIPLEKLSRGMPDRLSYFSSDDLPAGALTVQEVRGKETRGIVAGRQRLVSGKAAIKRLPFSLKPILKVISRNPVVDVKFIVLVERLGALGLWPAGHFLAEYAQNNGDKPYSAEATQDKPIQISPGAGFSRRFFRTLGEALKEAQTSQPILLVASTRGDLASAKRDISSDEGTIFGLLDSLLCPPSRGLGGIILCRSSSFAWAPRFRQPYLDYRTVAEEVAQCFSCPLIFVDDYPTVVQYDSLRLSNASFPDLDFSILPFDRSLLHQGQLISGALRASIAAGGRTFILVDRKGYGGCTACLRCRFTVLCPRCDLPLVFDKEKKTLYCRHCDTRMTPPESCPQCGGNELSVFGFGIQRIAEAVREEIPGLPVTVFTKGIKKKVLSEFLTDTTDAPSCLIGTEAALAGSDARFARAVVFSLESLLLFPESDAYENVFQRIARLKSKADELIIQTFDPEREFLKIIRNPSAYYAWELKERAALNLPPSVAMAAIECPSRDTRLLEQAQKFLHGQRGIEVLGPIVLPGKRYRLVAKARDGEALNILKEIPAPLKVWRL